MEQAHANPSYVPAYDSQTTPPNKSRTKTSQFPTAENAKAQSTPSYANLQPRHQYQEYTAATTIQSLRRVPGKPIASKFDNRRRQKTKTRSFQATRLATTGASQRTANHRSAGMQQDPSPT